MNIVEITDKQLIAIQEWGTKNLTEFVKIPFRIPFQGDAFQLKIYYGDAIDQLVYNHRKVSDDLHDVAMEYIGEKIFKITIETRNAREYRIVQTHYISPKYIDGLELISLENQTRAEEEMFDIFKETADSIIAVCNYFIFHEKEFKVSQSKEIKMIKKKGGAIQKAKGKNRYVKINTYQLIGEVTTKSEKTKIKKMISCEAWGVRGHVRKYKNGKTVYIKPYVKGKKRNEVAPKDSTYRI